MEDIPRIIKTSENRKIENPYYKGDSDRFHGPVDKFEFKTQQKNFEILSKKLSEHNIKLNEIYSSTINRQVSGSIQHGVTFLVTTNTPYIFWYKYESSAAGSGQNIMIINGDKINTTKFIKLDKAGVDLYIKNAFGIVD